MKYLTHATQQGITPVTPFLTPEDWQLNATLIDYLYHMTGKIFQGAISLTLCFPGGAGQRSPLQVHEGAT